MRREQLLARLAAERAGLLEQLIGLDERYLFEGEDWSFPGCVEVQWQHDAEHAAQIAAWREVEGLKAKTGPKRHDREHAKGLEVTGQ